jgi:hypothetical protein
VGARTLPREVEAFECDLVAPVRQAAVEADAGGIAHGQRRRRDRGGDGRRGEASADASVGGDGAGDRHGHERAAAAAEKRFNGGDGGRQVSGARPHHTVQRIAVANRDAAVDVRACAADVPQGHDRIGAAAGRVHTAAERQRRPSRRAPRRRQCYLGVAICRRVLEPGPFRVDAAVDVRSEAIRQPKRTHQRLGGEPFDGRDEV